MKVCGFGYPEAADIIKWHVVAMFAPGSSPVADTTFGTQRVTVAGCLLMGVAIITAHSGLTYAHSGARWCRSDSDGISCLPVRHPLTTTYTVAEKAKVQGVNDLAVFLTMITSSAASGALLSTTGWHDLNLYSAPFVLLAALAHSGCCAERRVRMPESSNTKDAPQRSRTHCASSRTRSGAIRAGADSSCAAFIRKPCCRRR